VSRLLALSLALLLAACSASSKSSKKPASADSEFKEWGSDKSSSSSKADEEEEEEPEFKDPKKDKLPEGPNCLDQKGDVMECNHDSDCCRGFYCGIDPSGSPRIKVCLYGGK
jgi:hypothetical protein